MAAGRAIPRRQVDIALAAEADRQVARLDDDRDQDAERMGQITFFDDPARMDRPRAPQRDQRLGLAEILMKRPGIAILDEPTATLDPHSTQEFLSLIRALKNDGTAVLLSSHHLDQVQSVCDRVALFNQGRIALSGSVTDLAQRVLGGGHVIDVEARGVGVRDRLAGMPGVVRVQVMGPQLYRVDCERDLRPEISRLLAPSSELTGIRFAEPSLNEVYTRYFDEVRHPA